MSPVFLSLPLNLPRPVGLSADVYGLGWLARQAGCRMLVIGGLGLGLGLGLGSASAADVPVAQNPAFQNSAAERAADGFLRQQERDRQLREGQERAPDVRLGADAAAQNDAAARLPEAEADCVLIQAIELVDDFVSKPVDFSWAISAANKTGTGERDMAVGRCLGSQGVNLVMRRIQNGLIARGLVTARVLAGEQTALDKGVLRLTVLPGRIRQVRFADNGAEATALMNRRPALWNAFPFQSGDVLNLRDIEQAMENVKRVPTLAADVQIVPAETLDAQGRPGRPGESDVVIQTQQSFPVRLSLSLDNSGSESTGVYQGGATVSFDNWWTLSDLFYVNVGRNMDGQNVDEGGTNSYTVHYSVPFGGSLLTATASKSGYFQTVAGANQAYVYRGDSQNSELELSRVVYRDGVRKISAAVKGWRRASQNFIDDTEIEVQRRRTAGWAASISHREFVGAATLDTDVTYKRATGAQDALAAPEALFGEGASRPQLWLASTELNAPFKVGEQAWRYNAVLRGQWNATPLIVQDRFSIGGRYTVRGFDGQQQLLGERGFTVRNELNVALGGSGQWAYLAADYGQVGGDSTAFLVGKQLSGGGLGLRGGWRGASYDVFLGIPFYAPAGFSTAGKVLDFNVNWSF
jgi:hemolysin activation/secretion protein